MAVEISTELSHSCLILLMYVQLAKRFYGHFSPSGPKIINLSRNTGWTLSIH